MQRDEIDFTWKERLKESGLEKAQDHQCKKSKRRSSKPSAATQASLDIWVSLGNVQGEKKAYQPWQHYRIGIGSCKWRLSHNFLGCKENGVAISIEGTDWALKLSCTITDSSICHKRV